MDEEQRKRADAKTAYRGHVDEIAEMFIRQGNPQPRRRIVCELRDRSLRRILEELGDGLTPAQRANIATYREIMDELARECDN